VLLLTAAIHAREYTTAELVTRFMEELVTGYGTDADVTWILDHHEVHAVLHANPDGRKQAETGISWRKNTNQAYCGPTSSRRGADLNRNFDFLWNCCNGSSDNQCDWDYHGPYAASEPEIQALQNHITAVFADQRGPDLQDAAPDDASGVYIDIHSYGRLVLWPWGFSNQEPPNAAQLRTLGLKLAYPNNYRPTQAVGLYPVDGASDDYVYGELGVAAYTIELGTRFFQSCSTFENAILPDNLPALLYAAKVARTPYLTPAGPDSTGLSVSEAEVTAGTPVTLSATIDDARYAQSYDSEPPQAIAAAEWYVDTPPWEPGASATPMTVSDGQWDSSIEYVAATLDTTGWSPGRHTLFVRGQDADGHWGAVSALFLSLSKGANEAPVAGLNYQCTGLSCQFDGSGSYDPDGQVVAYAWSFGDGATGTGVSASHTYSAAGTYTVTLTVTDDEDAAGTQTQSVAVDQLLRTYMPYVQTQTSGR
jgi:hypothetical protein